MKKFRKLFFILLTIMICGGVTVSVVINNIHLNRIPSDNTPSEILKREKLQKIEPFLYDIGGYSYISKMYNDIAIPNIYIVYEDINMSNYNHNFYVQNVNLQLKHHQQFILMCFKRSKTPQREDIHYYGKLERTGITFVFPNGETLYYSSGYFLVEEEAYLIQNNDRKNLDNFVNNLILLDENPKTIRFKKVESG